MGAVLQQQLPDKSWSPLAFFSKKLSDAEKKYSWLPTFLFVTSASCSMVEEFTIFTDHKPLTHALFRSSPLWSACQQRHLLYLAEFTSSIVHISGKENVVADTLSRLIWPSSAPNPESNPSSVSPSPVKPCSRSNPAPSSVQSPPQPIMPHAFPIPGALPPVVSEVSEVSEVLNSYPTMFLTSKKRDFTSALVPAPGGDPSSESVLHKLDASSLSRFQIACSSVQEMKSNPSLSVIVHPLSSGEILCDISTGSLCPLVPLQLHRKLFDQLHGCLSIQEINLVKVCLAKNVLRCWFVDKVLFPMPKI